MLEEIIYRGKRFVKEMVTFAKEEPVAFMSSAALGVSIAAILGDLNTWGYVVKVDKRVTNIENTLQNICDETEGQSRYLQACIEDIKCILKEIEKTNPDLVKEIIAVHNQAASDPGWWSFKN